jgi:hypothetical protein
MRREDLPAGDRLKSEELPASAVLRVGSGEPYTYVRQSSPKQNTFV